LFPPSRRRALACLGTAAVLLAAAAPGQAGAQTAGRIGPIHADTQDSMESAAKFVEAGGTTFFVARDSAGDNELYKRVGASAARVKDILPGPDSADPSSLVAFDGKLYFTAVSGAGRELWRSDGTAAGTEQVKDIRPGAPSANPQYLTVSGDQLFFAADDGTSGPELWVTDGAADGTRLVENLNTAPASGSNPVGLTPYGDGVIFTADDGVNGAEPRFSDGDAIELIDDLVAGADSSNAEKYAVRGDDVWFFAGSGAAKTIWHWDGDVAPAAVSGVAESPYNIFHEIALTAGRVYFVLERLDEGWEKELWTVDEGGAHPIANVNSGGDDLAGGLFADGSDLYFSAYDGDSWAIYRIDDTEQTVEYGSGELPGAGPQNRPPVRQGTSLFFTTQDVDNLSHLWQMADGGDGASEVVETAGLVIDSVTVTTSGLAFAGRSDATGTEPYVFEDGDLTALADINQALRGDGVDEDIAGVGQTAYFSAKTADGGRELFRTDGEDATLVKGIHDDGPSDPTHLTAFGNKVVFRAYDQDAGREPWISDGTDEGTKRLVDAVPGDGSSSPEGFTVGGGLVWFSATDGDQRHLFKSDGTTAGTTAVGPLIEGDCCADFDPIGYAGGKLWFIVNEEQLWSSDGTAAGTAQVALPDDAEPSFGTIAGDTVYVVAGSALVKVAPGGAPVLVKEIGGYGIDEIVAAGSRVVFSSTSSDGRRAPAELWHLWISDGTEAGTTEIGDPSLSEIGNLTRAGKLVYFGARDDEHGRELFKTDGTAGGTKLAVDFADGDANGGPGRSVAVGVNLVVNTNLGLFRVAPDGTATQLLAVAPGSVNRGVSVPAPGYVNGPLVRVGGSVLFPLHETGADTDNLWSTPAGLIGPAPADVSFDEPAKPVDDGVKQTPPVVTTPAPSPAPAPAPAPKPPVKAPAAKKFGITRFVASARKGTGTLTLSVPAGGSLKITGAGLKTVRTTLKSGTVKVTVTPGRKLARTLRRKGRASVELRLRYVPKGASKAVVVKRTVVFKRS
jgi:ELWxxDGT repeat protein